MKNPIIAICQLSPKLYPFFFTLIFWGPITMHGQNPDATSEARQLLAKAQTLIWDSLEYNISLEKLNQAESLLQDSPDSMLLAEIQFNEASCMRRTGKQDQALVLLENLKDYWSRTLGQAHEKIGDVYTLQSVCYLDKKEYNESTAAIDSGLVIYLKTVGEYHYKTGYLWNVKGYLTVQTVGWDAALPRFQRSMKIYSVIPLHLSAGYTYYNLGSYYSNKRDFKEAIKNYRKALQIRENFLPPDHRDLFFVLRPLGFCYTESGNLDKALQSDLRALEIAKKQFGESSFQYAVVCSALAFYTWSMDIDISAGVRYAEKAVDIFERGGWGDSRECGLAYNHLAICHQNLGNYNKALLFHNKALEIRIKLGEHDCDVGVTLNNIGTCYTAVGDYEQALPYFQRFLENRLQYCEIIHHYTGLAYNNIGDCYQVLGKSKEALEAFARSNEIFSSEQVEGHFQCYLPLNNLGWYYFRQKDYNNAVYFFDKAVSTAQRTYSDKSPLVASLLLKLAKVKTAQGAYETAYAIVDSALFALNYTGSIDQALSRFTLIDAWTQRAEILRLQYMTSRDESLLLAAREQSRQALDLLYTIAVDFSESLSKSEIMRNNYANYENALWIETELNRLQGQKNPLAFTYAERSKSLSLYQSMRASEALRFSGIPDSILQRESALRYGLTDCDKLRREKLNSGLPETDSTVRALSSQMLKLQHQYDSLTYFIEKKYPEYYRLKYKLDIVDVGYLQDSLLGPRQSLLEYFVGDSALYVFVVSRKKFGMQEIRLDFPLVQWIQQLRQGLFGYHTQHRQLLALPDSILVQYTGPAYKLYEKLIAPVEHLLTNDVVVIPDGPLAYVPFEVLLTTPAPNPTSSRFHAFKYWGDKRNISYSYSATLLNEMYRKQHETGNREMLLAMAPFFRENKRMLAESPDSLEARIRFSRDTLTALYYSGNEVQTIGRLLNGKVFLGLAADTTAFLDNVGRYRIIHLSTHGKADDKVGDYAWLGFSQPSDTLQYDKIFVKDLYNLSLNADLVVLSACETGIGQLRRGEGMISLARGFAYSGAKSIVTSLWSVDDKSTAELMQRFYEQLIQKGMRKDEALWAAKKAFLEANRGTKYAHPFFWAGFIPIGDMSTWRK